MEELAKKCKLLEHRNEIMVEKCRLLEAQNKALEDLLTTAKLTDDKGVIQMRLISLLGFTLNFIDCEAKRDYHMGGGQD